MKKVLLLIATLCFFTFQSRGQYGSLWAGYPTTYELSAGFATQNNPGYFWLGYLSTVQNINTSWHVNKNFCIMGSGMSSIWASYKVFESNACSGALTQVLNGNGVAAIEAKGVNGVGYALAGVYDKACYFVTLDRAGNVLNAVSCPFPPPSGNQVPPPCKPLIVESSQTGDFFICGCYESEIYILNVSSSGAINWSRYYNIGNDARPRDMMLNPYAANELIVVGDADLYNGDSQGFFLSVDGGSGKVSQSLTYGCQKSPDGFGSIVEGRNTGGGNSKGFVIAGRTERLDGIPGSTAWILKIDTKGNPIWSNVIHPVKGTNKGVIDLIQRMNTLGSYEYYALLDSDAGMHVLKLDAQGYPFPPSAPNALYNEFIYDLPASVPSKGNSLSYVNSPAASVNVGLQVYGTASNFPGFSSSYVVNAYFNGETNCYRTLTAIQDIGEGPLTLEETPVKAHGALSACTNFQVVAYFPGGSLNYPCLWQTLSGSNQRTMASGSGADPIEENGADFGVFPNPVADRTSVTYTAEDNSKITIEVYNLLGQQVFHAEPFPGLAGTYKEEIDFGTLNVKSGVYLVNITVDGKLHTHKIMYNR